MVEKLPKSMTDAKLWIQEAQITKQGKKKCTPTYHSQWQISKTEWKSWKKKAREGENTGTLEEQEQESGLSSLQTPYKQEENRVKYFKHWRKTYQEPEILFPAKLSVQSDKKRNTLR